MGNRVCKIEKPYNLTSTGWKYTFYVRDASGNIMTTYTKTGSEIENNVLKLDEVMLYGSSRIGTREVNMLLSGLTVPTTTFSRALGLKRYEMNNHLGNVLTTFTDRKKQVQSGSSVTGYETYIASAQDYYPFGMIMNGRNWNTSGYRFGFNGQEKDNEIYGDGNATTALFWEYDTRIGRRWNRDPKPKVNISNFSCFGNNPVFNNDKKGDVWDKSNDSEDKANSIIKRTTELRDKVLSPLQTTLESKLNNLDPSSQEYTNCKEQIKNIKDKITEINKMLSEMEEMKKSEQVYRLQPLTGNPNNQNFALSNNKLYQSGGDGGKTYYDKKRKAVVMEYYNGVFNTEVHELKHGYQFEIGKISFNSKTGMAGLLYDLTDEKEAFQRGSIFNEEYTSPLLRITNNELNDLGYRIPKGSLDIHSITEHIYQQWGGGPEVSDDTVFKKEFKDSGVDIINN